MDRKIPLSPEAIKLLERQKEEFAIRFGREPGPNDPIFFDEDGDTPSPMEFTAVPLETLDFTGSAVHLLHMTVGFARMDRRHVSRIAKVMTDEFGFRIRPFKVFEDRATFQLMKIGEASSLQLASVLKHVRSTPPVSFVDLSFLHDHIYYIFECDSPEQVRASFK